MKPWVQSVGDFLRSRWPLVRSLERGECDQIFDEFVSHFVRQDLQRRFRTDFGRSGVGRRYFGTFATISLTADMAVVFPKQRNLTRGVAAEVLWGIPRNFDGFHVKGPPSRFSDLLAVEGDAIVRVSVGKSTEWLFLADDTDELWWLSME